MKFNSTTMKKYNVKLLREYASIQDEREIEDIRKDSLEDFEADRLRDRRGVPLRARRRTDRERRIRRLNCTENKLREDLIKDFLFESYYDGLYLDDVYKENYKGNIQIFFDKNLDDIGGVKSLELMKENNVFISKVINAASNITENYMMKHLNDLNPDNLLEATDDNETDDVVFDKEDRKMIDIEKYDLNLDQVSNIIKDKIVYVIKKEAEESKKEKEEIEKIKTELIDIVEDEEELQEKMTVFMEARHATKRDTIFSALMLKNKVEMESKLHEGANINLDLIMGETIIEYTLLEFFNTINIHKYDKNDIADYIYRIKNNIQ